MNVNVIRSVRAWGMRAFVGLMFSLMLFSFMLRLKNDQASMQNRVGLLFQIANGPTYFGIMNAVDLCLISDPVLANGAVSLIMSLSITVGSGFIRNFQSLHPVFELLSYGSMHRYASSVLAANEFSNLTLTCKPDEYCMYKEGEDYLNITFPGAAEEIGSLQKPTESSKQPVRTRYLGHVTGYQPIRDQYFRPMTWIS
eukprot:sb/3470812/